MRTVLEERDNNHLIFNPPELGCVLYLPGLPGGGSRIYDRSPYGNHGTITGATWKRLPSGLWYLDYDGVDDRTAFGTTGLPTVDAPFTKMAWVKPDSHTKNGHIISWGNKQSNRANMLWLTSTNGYIACGFYANDHISASVVGIAALHFVAVTFDGATTTRLYIDKALVSTKADHAVPNVANTMPGMGQFIARAGDNSSEFDGGLALPRVFSTLWSTAELNDVCDTEKHLFGVW